MTDDETGPDELAAAMEALIMSDPAFRAAADQLRAAKAGPPAGVDLEEWEERRAAAVQVMIRSSIASVTQGMPEGARAEFLAALRRHYGDES